MVVIQIKSSAGARHKFVAALLLFLSSPVPAAAQNVDRAAFVANAVQRISTGDKWEYINFLGLLTDVYEETGINMGTVYNIAHNKLLADESIDAISTSIAPSTAFATRVYDALAEAGPPGKFVSDYLKELLRGASADELVGVKVDSLVRAHNAFRINRARAGQVMGKVYDLGMANSEFRTAFNVVYGRFLQSEIGDPASKIASRNPDFAATLNDNGFPLNESTADYKILESSLLERVDEFTSEMEDKLKEPASTDTSPVDFTTIAEQALAQQRMDYRLMSLRTGTALLGALMPDTAKNRQFVATLSVAIDAYEAIVAFNNYRQRETNESYVAVAGAAITMNVFLMVVSLVNAYEVSNRTSPELAILEALQALSKQMAQFQEETRARFDRIDAGLNTIYADMLRGFDTVLRAIGNANVDLSENRRAVGRVFQNIAYFQRDAGARLDLLLDQSFMQDVNRCTQYEQLAAQPMEFDNYVDCVASFSSRAAECSTAVRSGRYFAGGEFDFLLAREALSEMRWAEQINFIRELANSVADFGLSGRRANPLCWLATTSAYIDVAVANERHFRRAPDVFLESLINEGSTIVEDFALRLGRDKPDATLSVYGRLMGAYKEAILELDTVARNERRRILQDNRAVVSDLDFLELPALPSEAVSPLRERIIAHAEKGMAGVPAPSDVGHPYAGPQYPLIGNSGWPSSKDGASKWDVVLRHPWIIALEAIGLGTLDIRYIAQIKNHSIVSCLDNEKISGTPSIQYLVYLVAFDGSRRLVAKSPEIEFFPVPLRDAPYALTCPYTLFGFPQALESSNGLAPIPAYFEAVSGELSGEAAQDALKKEVHDRATEIRRQAYEALKEKLSIPTSDLSAILRRLDGIVLVMRGLTELTFPRSIAEDRHLRYLLYGEPSKHSMPLLTSGAVNVMMQTGTGDEIPLLLNLQVLPASHHAELIEAVEDALAAARLRPQVLPFVDAQLGRLELLRKLREVNVD